MSSEANKTQVAGNHYQTRYQHWDFVVDMKLDYFQAVTVKYVTRCFKKNGAEDLKKAQHFITKYIEVVESRSLFTRVLVELFSVSLGNKAKLIHRYTRHNKLNFRQKRIICAVCAPWINVDNLSVAKKLVDDLIYDTQSN